jgi:hypothetical protein
MKIQLEKSDIQNLVKFTSKQGTRYLLRGVSVQNDNGILELAATDGNMLAVMRRPLADNEQLEPGKKYILALPKTVKSACVIIANLQNQPGFLVLEGVKDKVLIEDIQGTFPNYRAVMPFDFSKFEKATGYAIFNPKKIQCIYDVLGGFKIPYHNNANTAAPYYFEKDDNGKKWQFAIMSCIEK